MGAHAPPKISIGPSLEANVPAAKDFLAKRQQMQQLQKYNQKQSTRKNTNLCRYDEKKSYEFIGNIKKAYMIRKRLKFKLYGPSRF